jgi:hypothetical protein
VVENAVKPVTDNIAETVKNELAALLNQTGEGTVAEAIQNAVNGAVAGTAKAEDLEGLKNQLTTLENNIAGKLGNSATEKEDKTPETPANKKRNFYASVCKVEKN